jgi:hypothetical protein
MNNLYVKSESLPERCEICHQSDFFIPKTNYCSLCSSIPAINRNDDDEFSLDIRAQQLLYYISGGAGIILGYIGWSIFHSFCSSINVLLNQWGWAASIFIGLVVGILIGCGIFNYIRKLRIYNSKNNLSFSIPQKISIVFFISLLVSIISINLIKIDPSSWTNSIANISMLIGAALPFLNFILFNQREQRDY